MSPVYKSGDYVLVLHSFFIPNFLMILEKDYIINHHGYGVMIKRLFKKSSKGHEYFFKGLNSKSVSKEEIGAMSKDMIKGLVLYHIKE